MSKTFDTLDWERKERKRYIRRMENFERQLDLVELANEIAILWMGKRKEYTRQSLWKWRRNAEVYFDPMDGQVKLTLYLTYYDSLKMLEPILWQFLDEFDYSYKSKTNVSYYHENDLEIVAYFEHSSYCKVVKTGRMIPETKIECG